MERSKIRQLINRVRTLTENLRNQEIFQQPETDKQKWIDQQKWIEQQKNPEKWAIDFIKANADAILEQLVDSTKTKKIFAPLVDLVKKKPSGDPILIEDFNNDIDDKFKFNKKVSYDDKFGLLGGYYEIECKTKYHLGILEMNLRTTGGYTPPGTFNIPNDLHRLENNVKNFLGNDFKSLLKLDERYIPKKIEIQEKAGIGVAATASFTISEKITPASGVTFYIQAEITVTRKDYEVRGEVGVKAQPRIFQRPILPGNRIQRR